MRVRAILMLSLPLIAACAGGGAGDHAETAAPAPFDPATRVHADPASDPQAIEIAQATVEAMGGWQAWDRTRFLSFKFFGNRQHYWDRHSGDWRMESVSRDGETTTLVLMNVDSGEGRVWRNDEELTGEQLTASLEGALSSWINDTYWVIMPFKLVDPGVTLAYGGETQLEDGRAAEKLVLTFADSVGDTPRNRYDVMVGKQSGLVEAWSFYADRDDAEARFTMPWSNWQTFGEIKIATDHGRDLDWAIAVHDALPRSVFEDPAPVEL